MTRHRLPISLALLLLGCDVDPNLAMEQDGLTVEQGSADVTVLSARATSPIGGQGVDGFDEGDCAPVDSFRMDCTDAFEGRMGAPALHRIVVPIQDSHFFCRVLEVTTVSKSKAVAHTDGIGFYYDGYSEQTGFHFTPAADLVSTGHQVLVDGGAATLHRFVGLANCWLGSASSSFHATYRFKPFMAFTAPDTGHVYRNWDLADDYTISPKVVTFDRSQELLH